MEATAFAYLQIIYLTLHPFGELQPGMTKVQIWGFRCERCSHEWVPREKTHQPKVCPACKSPYWDRPRRPNAKRAAKAKQPEKAASE